MHTISGEVITNILRCEAIQFRPHLYLCVNFRTSISLGTNRDYFEKTRVCLIGSLSSVMEDVCVCEIIAWPTLPAVMSRLVF